MQISLSIPELLTLFFSHNLKIQAGGGRHLGFLGYVNLAIPALVVWYLCAVPNLVQIYVIVTEIDALILETFI